MNANGPGSAEGRDLLADTAALVAIPSVSHTEKEIADHIESKLRTGAASGAMTVTRVRDSVIARTDLGRPSRLVLAGHTDTVPVNGNATPRIEGDILHGLGSADMKGGLAVMLALAEWVGAGVGSAGVDSAVAGGPAVDVTFVFYSGEEVSREHSGLLQIEESDPGLLAGDAAVLGEPTCARIEAGCQGVLRLEVQMGGTRAHTARPWMGVNAVHRLGPVLDRVAGYEARQPVIDGCQYREALQAVHVSGGVAGNVVPDRATLVLNHRFAPDRDPRSAEAALRDMLSPLLDPSCGDCIELVEAQPAAAPSLSHPLLSRLVDATGAPPRAKLGWTDVAFFAERGIPAVNFGPGDPELAHTAAERVERSDLERAYASLLELLSPATAAEER